MLVHDIIDGNALKRPDDLALVFEDGTRRTWAEVADRTARLAGALRGLGVEAGDRVGFLGRNSLELLEVYIGCSRLGAVFAPVNYRFAVPEIAFVLSDSEPRVLCAEQDYAETIAELRDDPAAAGVGAWIGCRGAVAGTQDLEALIATAEPVRTTGEIDAGAMSWICYTGGTTGRSKGAMLSHANMVAGAVNFVVENRIRPDDAYLVAGALFHIALAVPIAYWLVGARTVIMNFEPGRALDLMRDEGVTRMVATGTILKMLVDEMEARPRTGLRMRNMDTGGAPVPPRTAGRACAAFGCTVAQIYGQTESTLMATYLQPEEYARGLASEPGSVEHQRLRSVGRAAPMNVVRVIGTDDTDALPAREVGEIAVRGDTVMLGYWRRPELTAQTLCDGWLRTGDLGWMDEDGYVHLTDRKKDMIITGGENVYSSEVEVVLSEHDAVAEAVVIGVPDDHWGERVHAIVVAREGALLDPDAVLAFCRDHLAAYKVPKGIEVRDAVPRLPTGKIAKAALRDEYWQGRAVRVHGA